MTNTTPDPMPEVIDISPDEYVWTDDDDLGGIPDADLDADQTGGRTL